MPLSSTGRNEGDSTMTDFTEFNAKTEHDYNNWTLTRFNTLYVRSADVQEFGDSLETKLNFLKDYVLSQGLASPSEYRRLRDLILAEGK